MTAAPIELDDDLDTRFKPGIRPQLSAFVRRENADVSLPIAAHAERIAIYARMLAGTGGAAVSFGISERKRA